MPGGEMIEAPFVRAVRVAEFDAEVWDRCEPAMITRLWSGAAAAVTRHAEARICWSDEALHVRFVCNQREPLIVSAEARVDRKTLGLWDRDVCEIFVAPDPHTPERYFEFEAAPSGEWVDLGIVITPQGRETGWDYNSGMKAAASVSDDNVKMGIAVPWSESIPKPNRGDLWLVNLFRCVGPEAPDRYLAWRPTFTREPAFHVPEAFGKLRFT